MVEGEFYGPPLPDSKLPEAVKKDYHPGWGHLAAFKTKLVVHVLRDVKPAPRTFYDALTSCTTARSQYAPLTDNFTRKERDSETASSPGAYDCLDDFGARYYSSRFGRFMSPAPLGGHRVDPQTLNR